MIEDGETLATCARRFGLPWQKIWNDAHNADLRRRCGDDPDRLGPGDEVFVPERDARWIEVTAGGSHRFVARQATEGVRIDLIGADGLPLADGRWEIELDGELHGGPTSLPIEIDGPFASRTAQLRVFDAHGRLAAQWELRLAQLAPCTADDGRLHGLQARLQNLGFDPGPIDGGANRRTQHAIRAFQRAQGSVPTGRPQDVADALRTAHGS